MLPRRNKADFWAQLEKEANDDLDLLSEIGPAYFSVDHLMDLRQELREKVSLFERRQRIAMLMGASGAFWVMLAILARYVGQGWLLITAFVATVLCFAAYAFIIVQQQRIFKSKGELEFSLRQVEDELRKRAMATPSRSRDAL